MQPAQVTDIKFYKQETTEKLKLSKRKRKAQLPPSTPEKQDFLRALSECKEKPVCLSLFKDTYQPFHFKETIKTVKLPSPLPTLFDDSNATLTDKELEKKCDEISNQMKATKEEIDYLCNSTINQSSSLIWHEQRTGRVTASVVHAILHTDQDQPAPSLIKRICHPANQQLSTDAVKWGRDHESTALETYKSVVAVQHENVEIKRTGLKLCQDKSFIAATPDGVYSCSCCRMGVVEIKCPYKFRDMDVEDMLKQKECYISESFELKKSH